MSEWVSRGESVYVCEWVRQRVGESKLETTDKTVSVLFCNGDVCDNSDSEAV